MPAQLHYPWQRRWLPLLPSADLLALPYELDVAGYANLHSPSLVLGDDTWLGTRLDELTEKNRCVVLLGEPGIGKSREWQDQRERLAGQPGQVFVDLGEINSEDILRQEVLEAAGPAQAGDGHLLTLWLDSLDEGLLHLAVLQAALVRLLRRLPVQPEHVRLRILCRNAVWPASFSETLRQQLRLPEPGQAGADEAMLTLLLSPLSREQVAAAAEAEGFAAEPFLAAVAAADAQPLAGRPVTLRLLLNLYRAHQPTFGLSEAAGRAGLYELGCLELCGRFDEERAEAHRGDPHLRLLLAGYVAMLSVLTNRRVLVTESLPGTAGPNELDVNALSGGTTAPWRGTTAALTAPALRDVFSHTGLFAGAGSGRVVWAHQSYAEFLAAWYLNLTDISLASLRTLFRSTTDPAGGVVPALQETAAWLADLRPDFWNELLALDPVAVLQTGLRWLSPAQRARVVERLVHQLHGLALPPYQDTAFMRYLAHPGLAAQLTPLLTDPHTPGAVARFAADLARVAKVEDLRPLLLTQAFDETLPLALRTRALAILSDLADEATRTALRPLRQQLPADDPEDEFRGHLLPVLWPSHLSVAELLPLLARRNNPDFYGAYYFFLERLDYKLLASDREALLTSLRWVTHREIRGWDSSEARWKQLALYLQERAWELADDSAIAVELAAAIVAAVENYEPYRVGGTAEQRQALLPLLLPHHQQVPTYYLADTHFGPNRGVVLFQPTDWSAIYALLDTPLADAARLWLTELLTQLLGQLLAEESLQYTLRYGELYEATRRHPATQPAFAPWLGANDLEKEKAERNSEMRQQVQARARREANHRRCWRILMLHRSGAIWRDVRRVLHQGSAATLDDWRLLSERLPLILKRRGSTQLYDVVMSSRWTSLSPTQQDQAADVAWAALSAFPPLPPDWYQPGWGVASEVRWVHKALLLLQQHRPAQVAALPPAFWQSWGDYLIYEHVSLAFSHGAALLRQVAAARPQQVDDAIVRLLEVRARRKDSVPTDFADLYRALPGAAFPARLLEAIAAGTWPDEFSGPLLVELLKVDYEPAWAYATQLLPEPSATLEASYPRPDLVVPVYHWLLFDSARRQLTPWPWWQRLSTQPPLVRRVLSLTIYHYTVQELRHLAQLDEEQLEALILWLTYAFALTPADVDDWEGRPNGRIAAVRTAAAFELADRGTASAHAVLQRLLGHLGQPFWLRARLEQARENLRNAWEPLPPDALVTLSRETNRRWVRSATDLQELLLESLARFQADLQGEPTTAQVLWYPVKDEADRRKTLRYDVHEENYLSNVLRQHLRQDLQRASILVKREVEIRPAIGAGTGQRTDIFVEAFTRSPTGEKLDVVVVVIEVKLSRHKEVLTALNSQLVDYLTDQSYKHGIYLVGWHFGEHDPLPPNFPSQPELTEQLVEQAEATAPAYTVKVCLLDIRLPGDAVRQQELG